MRNIEEVVEHIRVYLHDLGLSNVSIMGNGSTATHITIGGDFCVLDKIDSYYVFRSFKNYSLETFLSTDEFLKFLDVTLNYIIDKAESYATASKLHLSDKISS